MLGPYKSPLALGREPLSSAFWAICAPILFSGIAAFLLNAPSMDVELSADETVELYQRGWFLLTITTAVQFALLSFWSGFVGAGPFAGNMRPLSGWILGAALMGPAILIGPQLIANMFMTEEGWQYASEYDPEPMRSLNWTLTYIFLVVVLAPIVEEVTFRGVAMGAILAKGYSPIAALVVSSFVFAFIHFQYSWEAQIVVFIAGLGFGLIRLGSQSVLAPIVAHMSANGVSLYLQSSG